MKAKAGKPSAGRKPGGELPYKSAEDCVGGPINNRIESNQLSADKGVKGGSSLPSLKSGKKLPQAKTAKTIKKANPAPKMKKY